MEEHNSVEEEVLEESPGGSESLGEEGEELAEEKFDDSLRPVASSMVSAWAYNREAGEIEVFFVSGGQESYSCSPDEWEEAKLAVSPGKFVHEHFL